MAKATSLRAAAERAGSESQVAGRSLVGGGRYARYNTALDPTKAKLSDQHLIFDGLNLKREK